MPSFAELLQQGTGHAWLFVPSAILLGALHGLEPGHSKTMMAAFIVAVRGTVWQAVLLGLAATLSHTIVVWGIALGGMYLWQGVAAESFEAYFQLLSAVIIIAIALWMLWRTWQDQRNASAAAGARSHAHAAELRRIDTGHGTITLDIFEDGVPPRWRLRAEKGHGWAARDVALVTQRGDGASQAFSFADRGAYLESVEEIPEPHEFKARLSLSHGAHTHDYDLEFDESHHAHDPQAAAPEHMDAHARMHAGEIEKRFAGRSATTGQIVMFGLTGGLIPCPASITVLLLCLQLKQFTLGAVLVLCFSVGLALTLVSVGAAAALSVRHASQRFSWFGMVAQRAPYVSSALIILVGIYTGYLGWAGLAAQAA